MTHFLGRYMFPPLKGTEKYQKGQSPNPKGAVGDGKGCNRALLPVDAALSRTRVRGSDSQCVYPPSASPGLPLSPHP